MLGAVGLLLVSWLTVTLGFHLGFTCDSDVQCISKNSICDVNMRLCVCKPTHPLKLYNSLCVEVARLGERCELSQSCGYLDEHSVCHTYRGCICKPGYREHRVIPNKSGKCVYKEKNYPYSSMQDSDEDDDDSHEDDDDDRSKFNDITTPVIVGLVLGSLIVCGWSFAICRLYLKRVERRRQQTRRKNLRLQTNRFSNTFRSSLSGPPSMMSTQYALLDLSRDQPTESSEPREDDEYLPSAPTPPIRESSLLPATSIAQSPSPPLISPDEEPLPAYATELKKEPDGTEPPPSYDEVMKQSQV